MNDKPKNPLAVALGKLAAGKPKKLSDAERARRAEQMKKVRQNRKRTGQI